MKTAMMFSILFSAFLALNLLAIEPSTVGGKADCNGSDERVVDCVALPNMTCGTPSWDEVFTQAGTPRMDELGIIEYACDSSGCDNVENALVHHAAHCTNKKIQF